MCVRVYPHTPYAFCFGLNQIDCLLHPIRACPLHGENLIIQLHLNNVRFIRCSVWFDANVISWVFFWLTIRAICSRGGAVDSTPSGLANKASKEAEAGLGRPRRRGAVETGQVLCRLEGH